MEHWIALGAALAFCAILAWWPARKPAEKFQVYGGPLDGTWTTSRSLPGYIFGEDVYSERRYHVWSED